MEVKKGHVMRGNVYQRVSLIFLIVLVCLLLFDQAFARGTILDQNTIEYYTYGGFTAVTEAWRKIGLIFSDSRFVGLFFGVVLLGVIILYFMVLVRTAIAGSAKFNLASWAIPVLLSMVVYMVFILPKKSIIVHDEVLNRDSEVISNIPSIIAITAGALNRIERELINIVKVSASSPVENYTKNAGGTGFVILSQFGDPVTITMSAVPMYVHQTAYQFIKDCLLLEIARSGADLTAQDINLGRKSFIQVIEEAKNPGIPTIYYDENGKEIDSENGQEVNCQIAGGKLITYIQRYNDAIIKASCALSGFNIDSPQEMNACLSLLESTYKDGLKQATGRSGDLNLLSAQAFFAQSLINTLNSINPESSIKLMATKEASSQYFGLAIHANTWLPVIRETLRAVAIAITPFVLLFAATPLVGRALGFILGMMIWVVTWSVIDAILHYSAVAQAVAASEEFSNVITNGTPGTMFFVLLPSYSSKVAASFGAIRWAGLGLATVLTGMLIRFGGAALAMVAGSITGAAQSAGAAMGRMVADVTSPIRADLVPTASWTNAAVASGGVSALAGGLIEQQAGSMLGQSRAGNYFGMNKIATATEVSIKSSVGSAMGTLQRAQEWGKTVEEMAREETFGGVKYSHNLFYGQYTTLARTSSGRARVADVKFSLIAGQLKRAQSQTEERVFSKIMEALDKKDFTTAWGIFKKYEHMISKEKAEQLRKLGEKIWGLGTGGAAEDQTKKDKTKEVITSDEFSIGASVGTPGGSPLGVNMGAGTSIERRKIEKDTQSSGENDRIQLERQFKYQLTGALTETGLTKDADTRGNIFEDVFSETHARQEARKLAEQYKELASLESSLSINALPLLVQHWGDKLLAQNPSLKAFGLNNVYDMAVRQLIEAIHSGDPQKIESILNELKTIQNQYSPSLGDDLIQKGKEWEENVTRKLQEQEKFLEAKKRNIIDESLWPLISPHVPEARALVKEMSKLSDLLNVLELLPPEERKFYTKLGMRSVIKNFPGKSQNVGPIDARTSRPENDTHAPIVSPIQFSRDPSTPPSPRPKIPFNK